ncbi:hypothetical protein Back11_45380 [Paenibacillus baekrokdamisoli]|uniref:Uncharacterized protein n=1 Tax=Paenibacillus baekrokdamisoli TaxID=1712516 RepID=A0A3G9JDZ7_9BACL|nr:DUF6157 family protein [Paenibacillus baekrokdamisoli]MBB3072323.1 hypothetical protein [Paenibacillus baekrokdamisoli]BBH23193.1 hypothetical protein Back11_45380 [Paenibacillus baekrokdamisoli]
MNWNYYDTFITVSTDCPVDRGIVPPDKKSGRTKPSIEFELVSKHPYTYTQEDVLFEVHVRHKGIPEEELAAKGTQVRDEFFQKPMACLRASMLPKKYGWGIHFNAEGKLALVPVESADYQHFIDGDKGNVKVLAAMRNSKK